MIGALDIGQAAIAVGGRAVALEGIEGTAGLLERMRGMRNHGRLAGKSRGALVKCVKPEQEERADMPTIGPSPAGRSSSALAAKNGLTALQSTAQELCRPLALPMRWPATTVLWRPARCTVRPAW